MSSATAAYGDPKTRRRILQATWELLDGRDATVTVADAADRAGVSRQAVYLHFGDRSGLLVALMDYIDESLGRDELRAYVHGAATGVESMRRWIETMSWYTGKIDRITQVTESGQYDDEALSAAWRNRMDLRRNLILRITERIASEGALAKGWTVDKAVDLVYAVTMPGPWRELTRVLGWQPEEYAEHVWRLVERGLLSKPARQGT
jgi:AcrR family transcriptional regulator